MITVTYHKSNIINGIYLNNYLVFIENITTKVIQGKYEELNFLKYMINVVSLMLV